MATTGSIIQEETSRDTTPPDHPSSPPLIPRWVVSTKQTILSELKRQRAITVPLIPMNSTWFAKTAITTAFLGRLGELQLAGGTLGFTFANVTGFSVLTGLCWAMEPICGQAYGAKNYKLLHKTLLMTTLLLLVTVLPISLLWLNVDKILVCFGQQRDIADLAKIYVMYLLPDLVVTAFLCPLKAYLSSQGITLPILFSSAIALALHVPLNILLAKAKGIKGVAMAIGLNDLIVAIGLGLYVLAIERRMKGDHNKMRCEQGGGWWDQGVSDWLRLIRLSGQCCVTGCLEWWCYEILILIAGRLPDAKRAVAVLTVVLNFDYLLYGVMISLATCASTRVSNELGAGRAHDARNAAYISLGLSAIMGCAGGSAMLGLRAHWGALFSHDKGVVDGVGKMLLLMALVEVFNFPLGVCGGIIRGTTRPWLGMYSTGGFYLVGLPLAAVLSSKAKLGLCGLLLGFLGGTVASVVLLVMIVAWIDWVEEAGKAEKLACVSGEVGDDVSLEIVGGCRV